MTLDHVGVSVSDFARSRAFYVAALAPLGIVPAMEVEAGGYRGTGFGKAGKPDFWIGGGGGPVSGPVHLAFAAEDRAQVGAFYAAAMAAGGRDNGPPGVRAQYHPDYYGAFVLDPDGANIEAVCHKPG
jgi:catechol 2,3-dioxygenase-like lactoylglutathione lyase family enzyme